VSYIEGLNMFSVSDIITKERLTDFCNKNHIKKLSLFGSALRGELREDSDIDLLVEFEEGHIPGLLGLAGIELELTRMIGRKVDLRTPAEVSRFFRDEVLSKAKVQYAA
jgi:predicted nucleotidyltransferase